MEGRLTCLAASPGAVWQGWLLGLACGATVPGRFASG